MELMVIQQYLALVIEQVTSALSCCGSLNAPVCSKACTHGVPRLFLPLLAMNDTSQAICFAQIY